MLFVNGPVVVNVGGRGGDGDGDGGVGVSGVSRQQPRSTKTSESQVVIIRSELPHEMQKAAVDCAKEALEMYEGLTDAANYIKKEFDEKYKPHWHCFVGTNFSGSLSKERNSYICFDLGEKRIILFKS